MTLLSDAQCIADQVTAIYLHHARPWLVGLIVHGSAVKGGWIAGCSDIDFQLFVEGVPNETAGDLSLPLRLAIHRDLATIEPSPFRYIQTTVQSVPIIGTAVGPIPGTYQLLAGHLPVQEATDEQLRDSARVALTTLEPVPSFVVDGLLDHGGGRLAATIRLLCTKVWPVLYHLQAVHAESPTQMWQLSKNQAIEHLPHQALLYQKITAFHEAVLQYYPSETSVAAGLAVVERGVAFLETAKAWWNEEQQRKPMEATEGC